MSKQFECRLTRYGSFPIDIFNRISCANCYKLLVYVFPESHLEFNVTNDGYLTNDYLKLDPTSQNHTQLIKDKMDHLEYDKWKMCCNEAENCCKSQEKFFNSTEQSSLKCSSIWDGWSCHPYIEAGKISRVKCPDYTVANTCNTLLDHAYFQCNLNGEWFRNEYGEWADYTSCEKSILPIKERLINVNIFSQSISLVFLIIGLIIFFSFKKLKTTRIVLHKNFFISLILNSICQIIWESAIMRKNLYNSDLFIDTNHPGCIIANLLTQYTRSTNFFWMLCESLYLHQLLISVFKEQTNIIIFYFIGWGIPLILCSIYALATFFLNNHSCWTRNDYLNYILNVPNIITIIFNFVFLINIIRVLYKKLTAENTNENHQYRKAVRATLFLVPLFGLHLILSPYIMCDSSPGSQFHNVLNRLVESLQGFIVALIYCFLNGEVLELIKEAFLRNRITLILREKFHVDEKKLNNNKTQKNTISKKNKAKSNRTLFFKDKNQNLKKENDELLNLKITVNENEKVDYKNETNV